MTVLLALLLACGGDPAAAPTAEPAPAAAPVAQAHAKPSAEALAEGKRVYDTYCVSCHQADGTGMNGMLGANFRADKTRLAKDDATLTQSIKEGKTGPVGTMPPWGATLSDAEVSAVLGYIRDTYGD